jgi:cell division protein FtsZ
MSDELQSFDQQATIKVVGVGGGGGNAVDRMIQKGLSDVEFITVNTDAQALRNSPAGTRLQIGVQLTGGLGSGAKPDIGFKAAEEDRERIREVLRGADMVFLTAGLGGGTGTGASPIVAEEARNSGALTVAIVTLPFSLEGRERMANAQRGLDDLEKHVDTLIVVPNDRVATLCGGNTSLIEALTMADEVLANGVRAITELITVPGLINLDFADVRTIMQARGRALMGIGLAEGEQRATRAAEEAIVCPLLEHQTIHGAMGVIVNIRGGRDITMHEVQTALSSVKKAAHPDANIIFGAVVDEDERTDLQVTVIAAGFAKDATDVVSGPLHETRPSATHMPQRPVTPPTPITVAPTAKPVAAPAPALAPQKTAQAPNPAPAPVAPAAAVTPMKDSEAPKEELLFPEEPPKRQPEAPQPEPERDMGIPTFLWKRMQQRKK